MAAFLTDEYVLRHASGSVFAEVHREGQQRKNFGFRLRMSLGVAQEPIHLTARHVPGTNGRYDPTRICHSCKNNGHWKGECPTSMAGQKPTDSSVYMKSAGLVSSARHSEMSQSDGLVKTAQNGIENMYVTLCL